MYQTPLSKSLLLATQSLEYQGASDDSPLILALPVGRERVNGQDAELLSKTTLGSRKVQYRVVLEATGEIKNFVSPPARVEEG